LWSSNYDRAMTGYLSCLKEFGEYAEEVDKQLPQTERSFYGFPFAVEGDKVQHKALTDSVTN
jgi:beclin